MLNIGFGRSNALVAGISHGFLMRDVYSKAVHQALHKGTRGDAACRNGFLYREKLVNPDRRHLFLRENGSPDLNEDRVRQFQQWLDRGLDGTTSRVNRSSSAKLGFKGAHRAAPAAPRLHTAGTPTGLGLAPAGFKPCIPKCPYARTEQLFTLVGPPDKLADGAPDRLEALLTERPQALLTEFDGPSNHSLLNMAAYYGNARAVAALIAAGKAACGVDRICYERDAVSHADAMWHTPLHHIVHCKEYTDAVKAGVAKLLLAAGANSTAADKQGLTPLSAARRTKNAQDLERVISRYHAGSP